MYIYNQRMKKFISIITFLFGFTALLTAQFDESIPAKSFFLSADIFSKTENIVLPPFLVAQANALDFADAKNGKLPLFSRNISTQITLNNAGSWTTLPSGGRVWRVQITSKNALALIPLFDKLYLPKGSTLHVYMPQKEEIIGAFTNSNTPAAQAFCTGIIHGETCIVEYFEPSSEIGKGIVSLNEIGHAYRWISELPKPDDGYRAAGSCQVNVACAETANFLDQKRAVARILVVSSQGQGYCSGALINNVRQDCTPYFLSAQHCGSGTSVSQYNQWVFYFNYEATACSGTSGAQNKTVNGCSKKADSNDDGGDTGSDFLLLQLNSQPLTSYNVYYAGWNTTANAAAAGVSIHHPDGDIKKISTYAAAVTSSSWGSVANTHWLVKWVATANGHGVTEGGSSGSPLLNNAGEIVGTLTGGDSYCNATGQPDQYGKFARHWTSNGTIATEQLKPWLDPDNTGATLLAGTNTPCGSTVQNDAGIQSIVSPVGSLCNTNTVIPQVILRNFGANTLTTVTVNYSIDGNVFQYDYAGNLTSGATVAIILPAVNLAVGNHSFIVETINPNGTTDNNISNDIKTQAFTILSTAGNLTLNLNTDNYGSETTWQVTDATSTVIASGGPYGNISGGQTIVENRCVPAGCFTFTIFDSEQDGIDAPSDGNFTLSGNGITYASLANPSFGALEAHSFCIIPTLLENETISSFTVYPNPSNGLFTVQFKDAQPRTIFILDYVGKVISKFESSSVISTVDLQNQSKGFYLLQVQEKSEKLIHKLILN